MFEKETPNKANRRIDRFDRTPTGDGFGVATVVTSTGLYDSAATNVGLGA